MFKEKLEKEIQKQLQTEISLETPANPEFGDFAIQSYKYKKSPIDLQKRLKLPNYIEKTEIKGPYLNFFLNKKILAEETLKKIQKEKKNYGKSTEGKGKTIVIDLSSPNIAKPFGIGHLRSTIIGNALGNIASALGFKVIKINYLGDWGTQFGKLITGYKRFGDEKQLEKEPIKHLLDIYVKVNQDKNLEDESRLWFKRLEEGDKEALRLWKKFRNVSLEEFDKIYSLLGVKFDIISGESLYNNKMEETIKELEKKKITEKSDGALIVNLEKYNLNLALIKKSDETTLYMTRDITAAKDRKKTYKFHKMIYEVGSEQKLHFQQLFKILELLGYSWAKDCVHVNHGLYLDQDGKKFATRKGKTVFMIDIINESISLAKKVIEEKNPSLENKDEVAKKVGVGAIIYGDLKNNRVTDMIFDIDSFLNFEGNTGPYVQYTYARANSILRKANSTSSKVKMDEIQQKEFEVLKQISTFPDSIKEAYLQLSPHILTNYIARLSQSFNEFYHSCPVLNEQDPNKRELRLIIVKSTKQVLENALNLLGIEAPESM